MNAAPRFVLGAGERDARAARVCLVTEQEQLTYHELADAVGRLASALRAAGIGPGDRLLLLLSDVPDLVVALWATMWIGAVPAAVSPKLAAGELAAIAADLDPALVVLEAGTTSPLAGGTDAQVWTCDGADGLRRCSAGEAVAEPVPRGAEDPALIQYTSGSTGRPKGVVHRHEALLAVAPGMVDRLGLGPEDRCLSSAKLSFGYGFGNSVLFPQWVGASTALSPGLADPYAVLDLARRLDPTFLFVVPSLVAAMLRSRPEGIDLGTVRRCVSAGERLDPALAAAWLAATGVPVIDGLGSTECLHIFLAGRFDEPVGAGSGEPVAGYEVRLVDDGGQVVDGPTDLGHLQVRGRATTRGYWRRPDATAATVVEGWVRTGDQVARDERGRYRYVGRADDIVKVGGLKVAPSEVEAAVLLVEGVSECAVVGVPDGTGLTVLHAFVRPSAPEGDRDALERAVRRSLRGSISAHKVPRHIQVVDDFPRTATGKIARFELRRRAG